MLNILIGIFSVMLLFLCKMVMDVAFESMARGIFKVIGGLFKLLSLPVRIIYKWIANMITEGNKNDC